MKQILPAIILLLLLISSFLLYRFQKWCRLSHIPGPFFASLSSLWMAICMFRGNEWRDLGEIFDKYDGPITRVGPNEVLVSDAAYLRRIWGVRTPYRRSNWYTALRFNPERDNLLSGRDDQVHNSLRTSMNSSFSGKQLEYFERTVDINVVSLIDLLNRKYISSEEVFEPVDIASTAEYYTLDIITQLTFGQAFGFLTSDGDVHDYIQTVKTMMPMQMLIAVFPALQRLFRLSIAKYFLPNSQDPAGMGKVIGVAKEVVAARFAEKNEKVDDLLGSFIEGGLNQDEASSELLVQIIAGSDTSATHIRMTILYLLTSPNSYNALKDEIAANAHLPSPIPLSIAKSLPYLQACMAEGLRLCPPVAALSYMEVPSSGDIIDGIRIPPGTKVGPSWWQLSRDKDTYGENAHMFRPERWTLADEARRQRMERANEMFFKPGRWTCVGNPLAVMEVSKAIFELLRNFDLALVDPTRPMDSVHAGVFLQSKMFVRVTRRRT